MSTLLHSSASQELFEKYVCNHSSHHEKYNGAMRPNYHLKLRYPLPSLSAMSNSLCSSTNQELFEKHLCNQDSHVTQSKPSHASTLFTVSKDEWNMKEDTGYLPEECIGRTVVCQKTPLGLKQHQTVKKSNP